MCAAVRWLAECSGGGVLNSSDSTTIVGTSMTVLVALALKHHDPYTPPHWIFPSKDNLPLFEDSEITGSHILSIAHRLQGDGGPGGCDASHWRDIILPLVPICVILLQGYVVISAILLSPGITSEL